MTNIYVEIYVRREDFEKISKVTDLLQGKEAYEESPDWLRFLAEETPIRYVTDLIEKGKGIAFVGSHSSSHEFGSYAFYSDGENTKEWECACDDHSILCVDVLNPEAVAGARRFAETHKRILDAAVKSIEDALT